MWLTLLLGFINIVMSFIGNRVIKFSGLDIAPAGIAILAWQGENVIFGALVLVVTYAIPHPKEFRYLWITLPLTIALGFLAPIIPNAYVLIFIYHAVGLAAAIIFQYFGIKYFMFILMNVAVNFMVARAYGVLT
jgi:hypothetical protein